MVVHMLRKHASLVIAMSLIALVATACIIRTRRPPPGQTSQPVMVEKHKEQKHKEQKHKEQKHKDPHDNGHGNDDHKQ